MLIRRSFVFVFALSAWAGPHVANADSPLTSTDFYKAYLDMPLVMEGALHKVLNPEMFEYLTNPAEPLDQKLALINSFGFAGRNGTRFLEYCRKRNPRFALPSVPAFGPNRATDSASAAKYVQALQTYLTPDEMICYAYLWAMQAYSTEAAIFNSYLIALRLSAQFPDNYSYKLVWALVKGNFVLVGRMGTGWCDVYKAHLEVHLDTNLTRARLRPDAMYNVAEYLRLYKQDC